MSPLRLAGLAVAALILVAEVRARARRAPLGVDGAALVAAGLLGLVSLVPALASVPADVLQLHHTPGGRLITLAVLSGLAAWPLLLWTNEGWRRRLQDADAQLEAVLGLVLRAGLPAELAPVVVLIPALDEGASIGGVVARVPGRVGGLPVRVVVACDGCGDDTASRARAAGAVALELPANRGAGSALRLGYEYAARAGARVVVTMDADGQHRPEDLERVAGPIVSGEADFVIGSRRLGGFEPVSRLRTAGLGFFNALLNLLAGTRVTDCSSGYRAFSVARLPRLATSERQYHTAEVILLARRRGLRIREVPIEAPRRIAGASRKGGDLVYGIRFGRVLISRWIRG